MAGVIRQVLDDNLAIVLDPPLSTQDVVDAGGHFVPLKVISKTEREERVTGGSQQSQPQAQQAILLYTTRQRTNHPAPHWKTPSQIRLQVTPGLSLGARDTSAVTLLPPEVTGGLTSSCWTTSRGPSRAPGDMTVVGGRMLWGGGQAPTLD